MNEKTPLLSKYKNKNKKDVLDQDKITCNTKNQHEVIEIISNRYNFDYFFDISATNCIRIRKLGTTIYGMVLVIEKKKINKPCIIKWKMLKH